MVYLSGNARANTGPAPIAQSAERLHGKEKVNGSIPFGGSKANRSYPMNSGGAFGLAGEKPIPAKVI